MVQMRTTKEALPLTLSSLRSISGSHDAIGSSDGEDRSVSAPMKLTR